MCVRASTVVGLDASSLCWLIAFTVASSMDDGGGGAGAGRWLWAAGRGGT